MEKICIDYDMAVDFLRGEPMTVEKIKYYSEEEICVSSFTSYRLLRSVRKTDVISRFLSTITILPFDQRASFLAANISKYLEEKDISLDITAIYDAAICLSYGALLISKDRSRYEGIDSLRLI